MTKRLLAVAVISILVCGIGPVEAQSSRSKSTKLKSSLKSLEAKKNAVKKQIRETKRDAQYVLNDIEKADRNLDNLESDIDDTRGRLNRLNSKKVVTEQRLASAEKTMKEQSQVVRARLRRLYMQPEGTALGALLAADSLGDLASRNAIFGRIAAEDKETFEGYKRACDEIRTQKKELEGVIAETHQLINRLKDRTAQVARHKQLKKGLLVELRQQQSTLQNQFDALDRESNKIEAQLSALFARSGGGPAFGGRFIRPVNGRQTSGYGSRYHPILHRQKMHTGIDFGAPSGTTIVASAPGTVVSASYRGGYGNTVIIDHGGGIATLYGHCSRLFVSSGQKVRQGQKIAAVGSTGMSTGPHLHFEVRVNGKPVNPNSRI